jgi:membrane-associated protease RseP (regulator of RpoE activity)
MKKGMLAGCMLVLLLTAAALAAFAVNCPDDTQYRGEFSEPQKSKSSYLGVEVADVESDRVAALKLPEETGVEVTAVDEDAPAGKAGFKEHDVILSVNGTKIESEEQLRRTIREFPSGRSIDVLISRDGKQMTLKPTLASRQQMTTTWVTPHINPEVHVEPHIVIPPMPPMAFTEPPDVPDVHVYTMVRSVGAMVENLTPQLRDFFGVKNGSGVLIRSVEKGSPAEAGGLRAGDVIIRVGQERINDSGDWRREMRSKGGDVSIGIVRDKREQNVTVKLPVRRQTGEARSNDGFDLDLDFDALGKGFEQIPKIAEEQKMALLKAQKEWQKAQGEWQKDFEAQRGEWQKQVEKATKQSAKEQEKSMKELRKQMEKLQKDIHKQFHYISFQDFE